MVITGRFGTLRTEKETPPHNALMRSAKLKKGKAMHAEVERGAKGVRVEADREAEDMHAGFGWIFEASVYFCMALARPERR